MAKVHVMEKHNPSPNIHSLHKQGVRIPGRGVNHTSRSLI